MKKSASRRLLPVALAMSLFASLWGQVPARAAASEEVTVQSDLTGHWAEDMMTRWAKSGLLNGDGAGRYRPNDAISRAEFAALIDRSFNLPDQASDVRPFADVNSGAWYAAAIANVYAAGMIQGMGKGKFDPEAAITRQDATVIIARAFQLEDTASAKAGAAFSDAASISAYASEAVAALQSRQYVSGRGGNRFAPKERISRAEVVQLIDNVMGSLIASKGTYERDYAGNVAVNTAGVELKNLVIAGDLYITQGVGEGDILLDGVTVKGKTYVFGGGSNSVKIKNSQLAGTLVVNKPEGPVRIVVSGTTHVGNVLMLSGGILEEGELTGAEEGFKNVDVNIDASAQSREVILVGRFGQIRQVGVSVSVLLKTGTVVETFIFDAIAIVTGDGTIRIAQILVSGSNLNKWPDKVNFGSQITVTVAGKLVDKAPPEGSSGSGTAPTGSSPSSSPSPEPSPSPSPSPEPTPEPDTELKIVDEGSAKAAVVINGTADDQTQEAARKLIKYVKKATGVELPLFVDRLNSDTVTAENGTIQVEFVNLPVAPPVAADFKVQAIIDGKATLSETPSRAIWDEATKTVTLTVMRVEKSTVQQSVKYQIRYREQDAFSSPQLNIPANPKGSLLKNSSFEAGYQGLPARPWEYGCGGNPLTCLVERSAEQAKTGKYSLKVSGATSPIWPLQTVELNGSGEYEYTAYIYTPAGSTTNGIIYMLALPITEDNTQIDEPQYYGPNTQATISNGGWQQLKWTVNMPAIVNGKNVVKALVGFTFKDFAAGETAYLDDATLVKVNAIDADSPVNDNQDTVEQTLPEQYDGIQIYLGKNGLTAQERSELLGSAMDADGFVMHQNGKRITIAGPTSWGTEFGVNEFLERYVGVRWLMPGEDWEDVPQTAALSVPVGDEVKQEPAFFSRAFEEQLPQRPALFDWARNLRIHDKITFTHNLYRMLPVSKYPQFYEEGTPDLGFESDNPCFQSEGIVEESIRIINTYFDENPDATSYSLGINDTLVFCGADPLGKRNSLGLIDMSDSYFDWVDKVSRGVFAQHPDKYLGAYAYLNITDPPTNVTLDPRVVIYITDERMAWGDPDMRQIGHALSEAWTQVGATVAFYDYLFGTPYVLPRTAFQLMADEYRYAESIGVNAYYSELYANFGEGPKPYLSAKLKWDPQQDVEALLDDWYERAVGPEAAADLKAYYQKWQQFWEQDIFDTQWYQLWKNDPERMNYMQLLSPDYLRDVSLQDMVDGRQLLESVIAKAQTQQQKKRAQDLLRMFEFYELSKLSYVDMSAAVAAPTNDAEASAILNDILNRNVKMDQRKALLAEFSDFHSLYYQYKGPLTWATVSSKETMALSSWIKAHPNSTTAARIEQLAEQSTSSTVRNAMKLILLSVEGTVVKNPGFEDGLQEWFNFSDTVANLTSDANSGSKAVMVNASSVEQDVFVESGKTYKLTFYAKVSGAREQNLLGINFWDVPGVGLTGAHVTVDSEAYKKYSITFTPPEGFSHVTIVIYKAAGAGWVYADDFTLTELPADYLSLTTVTGENGTVRAVFNKSPEEAPIAADFTVQANVDGQEAVAEQPTAINWDSATHTATLDVQSVTPANMAQTVKYRVTYKGEDTLLSSAIAIVADPQASALKNTSFEIGYGEDTHARPWAYGCGGQPGTCVTVRSDEQARTGQYSLKLSGVPGPIWPLQTVELNGFGQYEYSAYLYKPQGTTTSGTVQMLVIPMAADGSTLDEPEFYGTPVSATVSNGDWHKMKWTVNIPEQFNGKPVVKAMVGFTVMGFAAGETVYLDDVTLKPLSVADLTMTAVTVENGTVQALFNKSPEEAPAAADFTVQAIVDGQEAMAEQPTAISWDSATHTATLAVQSVTPANVGQTVKYRVTYKGEDTLLSAEIAIAADPQASALKNASFEFGYGEDTHARPWAYGCGGQPATCVTVRSDEQAKTGHYSLKLSGVPGPIWPLQTVELNGSGQYEYTMHLYTPAGSTTGGTIQMLVLPMAADGSTLDEPEFYGTPVSATVSNGEWQEIKWTVNIPEQFNGKQVVKAMIGFTILGFGAGESVYLDDVTLNKQ
ncbi:DUF4838 domain-containing protein [Cohnella phaseoli]|uniref:Carbohydrate binding protein n=1 Tax=Cohnella phaseoli TaxID=456490 RepID=A0A3D9IRT3_9BACL|nr:DUF4838 domain-containing protein [Cohnella phaseoli]RED64462.1 carbohydrate binding protein [Cohnella phaseoli]